MELLTLARSLDDVQIILCGRKKSYIEDYGKDFETLFSEFYERYEIVNDLSEVMDDDYLKIAVCDLKGVERYVYPKLKHLEDHLSIKVSAKIWLDLSHHLANKGHALAQLQQQLKITPDETMVFGDYNNDLEMMHTATYSFAMENAHPNIIKAANYTTKSNDHMGVEYMLEKMIAAKRNTI